VRQHGYGRQRLVVTGGNARGLRDIGRFPETDALHGDLTDLTVEIRDLVFLCIFAVVDNWILKCFNMLQLNALTKCLVNEQKWILKFLNGSTIHVW